MEPGRRQRSSAGTGASSSGPARPGADASRSAGGGGGGSGGRRSSRAPAYGSAGGRCAGGCTGAGAGAGCRWRPAARSSAGYVHRRGYPRAEPRLQCQDPAGDAELKPLRWLFLQTKDDAKERMDPFFHVLYTGAKVSPHVAPESVYWGPGMQGYDNSKSLKANLKSKYGDEVRQDAAMPCVTAACACHSIPSHPH